MFILKTVAAVIIIEHSSSIELKVGTNINISDCWPKLKKIYQVLFFCKVSVAVLRHSSLRLSSVVMMMMVTIAICRNILTCTKLFSYRIVISSFNWLS